MPAFSVRGIPKAQPRARAVRRGAHAGVYDPGTADGWKAAVRAASLAARPPEPMLGALSVRLVFRLARPKGHYRAGGRALSTSAPAHHAGRPDVDNLAKAVLDALTQEGWWRDDAQIVELAVAKEWSDERGQGADVEVDVA